MQDSKEILAVGSIAFDSIKTPRGNRDNIIGGSCTYFSVAASHYTNVSIIGVVGNDFQEEHWDLFKKYTINTQSITIENGKTFSWGGEYNHDYSHRETLFTNLGVFENFKPIIKQHFNQPILYLGNIQPELQLDVINKVKAPHLIAADSMNLWIDLFPQKVWELISKVDIFMLNDEEAIQLTRKNNLEDIAREFLDQGPQIVIIKKGSHGSLIAYNNHISYVSVVPNTTVYDPTGAGDSFAGGVLGYISNHGLNNPIEAVIHGTAIASYTVSGFGLEELCKINKVDLDKRINQISYK
ncbi:MAG: sugar kinase [Candidatus Marinimicrobia bacterium]|nr:sugar kinase [Candidatus Neomarinimicrobiota bacterium]|tara:strand:- start:17049 stop:17939 length:891 start_codon:yes stop_codon:yes gene_type:complete